MEFQYNFLLFCRCEKSLNRCFGANERDTFGATHFSPFLASFFFGSLRKSGGICYMKSESFRLLLNNTSWSYSSKCHQFCNGFLEWINAKVHPLRLGYFLYSSTIPVQFSRNRNVFFSPLKQRFNFLLKNSCGWTEEMEGEGLQKLLFSFSNSSNSI